MSTSGPSFLKITLAVAAGIILAVAIIVFALTGIGAASQRADQDKADAEAKAVRECRGKVIRAAKSMDEVVANSKQCEELEAAYRAKGGATHTRLECSPAPTAPMRLGLVHSRQLTLPAHVALGAAQPAGHGG